MAFFFLILMSLFLVLTLIDLETTQLIWFLNYSEWFFAWLYKRFLIWQINGWLLMFLLGRSEGVVRGGVMDKTLIPSPRTTLMDYPKMNYP